MDGAWRSAGADGGQFVEALIAKDAKNRSRTWPDWRTLKPDEVSEHVEPGSLARGTVIRFMNGSREGRVVGPSAMPGMGGEWYEVEHEPWAPGGPTRIAVNRDNMVVQKETAK